MATWFDRFYGFYCMLGMIVGYHYLFNIQEITMIYRIPICSCYLVQHSDNQYNKRTPSRASGVIDIIDVRQCTTRLNCVQSLN